MGDMSDFSPRLARPHLLTALALPPHCIRRALIVRSLSLTLPLSLPLCPGFRRCSILGLVGKDFALIATDQGLTPVSAE